jgi:Zn-dependent peptidase ImmA (M78 family)
MSVYYYSNNALESKARYIISQYSPHLLLEPAPIPIEAIIEDLFGLTVQYYHIRNNGRVLGETVFEDSIIPVYDREGGQGYKLVSVKAGTIIIDGSLLYRKNDGRLRYTCAHELAHWILHKEFYTALGETAAMTKIARNSEEDKAIERQADKMSSYLLMPKGTVKMAFHRSALPQSDRVIALAKVFCVSSQAMKIRLDELGLAH